MAFTDASGCPGSAAPPAINIDERLIFCTPSSVSAYALALAEGRPVLDAARFASAAAAIKCSRHGGREGSPTRQEVDDLLRT